MTKHFFLSYGGPGSKWTENPDEITALDKACRERYRRPIRKIQYNIKGIDVTVCTYGVHRALRLDIPDAASEETLQAFEKAKQVGLDTCNTKYALLGSNCVSAVAKVLHSLDKRITPENTIWPWNLDANVKKYGQYYPETSIAGNFISKYTEIADREFFSFMRPHHWQRKNITSDADIIAHAYGKTKWTGERTKSTLIELGWVTEDKWHILRPTNTCPKQFRDGLYAFNDDYEQMLGLKDLYNKEASFFARHVNNFFKDDPDCDTALKRLQDDAAKNPNGASERVLAIWAKRDEPTSNPTHNGP